MKKLMILSFAMIILMTTLISAPEWDNRDRYSDDNKTITITNIFGLGDDLGSATLTSHPDPSQPIFVIPGKDRVVMTYNFTFTDEYKGGLGTVQFTDMDNGRRISKDYYFATAVYGTDKYPVWQTTCRDTVTINGTENICTKSVKEEKTRRVITGWKQMGNSSIPKGTTTIALITDVIEGDNIDGVWTIAGRKASRHAVWTSGLNTGLLAFWTFNETSGNNLPDVTDGEFNYTRVNMEDADWVPGLINNSLLYDGVDEYAEPVVGANLSLSSVNGTISVWLNATDSTENYFMGRLEAGLNQGDFKLNKPATDLIEWEIRDGVVLRAIVSDDAVQLRHYVHVVVQWGDAGMRMYINGTLQADTDDLNQTPSRRDWCIGGNRRATTCDNGATLPWAGTADEMGIWNRTLSAAEVLQLYNNHTGITFDANPVNVSGLVVEADSPVNGSIVLSGSSVIFNATLIPTILELSNATLSIFNSTDLFFQGTNNVSGNVSNITNFNVTVSTGIDSFEWFIEGCGTNLTTTVCNNTFPNNTFVTTFFTENNQTFNGTAFETDTETFTINLTTNEAGLSITGTLIYNDTSFVGTVTQETTNTFLISRAIDIPLITIAENNTFLWEIRTVGNISNTFNSSVQSQNVSNIFFVQCNATFTVDSFNFTAAFETNLTRINPYDFDASFDFFLGNGNIKANNSFTLPAVADVSLCISPPDRRFFFDGVIAYDGATNGTFVPREFNFLGDNMTNQTQNISLLLLETADSTSFIMKVQDQVLIEVPQALIEIEKFFPGLDEFRIVQRVITDDDGKTIAFFETETIDYRFRVIVNQTVELLTTKAKVFGEEEPFTIVLTIGELILNPVAAFEDLANLVASIVFSNVTNIVTYTYTDTSGNFTSALLLVKKFNPNVADDLICNESSTTSSDVLSCDLTGLDGTFAAQGFIERSPDTLVDAITFVITTVRDIFGDEGLYLSIFIILVAFFAFIWNPSAGIIAVNVAVIFVNIIGFVAFSPIFVFSLIGISLLVLLFIRT